MCSGMAPPPTGAGGTRDVAESQYDLSFLPLYEHTAELQEAKGMVEKRRTQDPA